MSSRRMAVLAVVGSVLAVVLMLVNSLSGGSDLRTGIVPVAAGLLAGSTGLGVLAARSRGIGVPRRWASVIALVTAVALVGVAGFFFSLAGLSVIGSDLLSADTALASVGTLVASVLTFVIVPGGVVLFGLAVFRDRRVPAALHLDLWMLTAGLIVGGAVISVLPDDRELWAQFAWFALLAVVVMHFSAVVSKTSKSGSRSSA